MQAKPTGAPAPEPDDTPSRELLQVQLHLGECERAIQYGAKLPEPSHVAQVERAIENIRFACEYRMQVAITVRPDRRGPHAEVS